MEWFCLILEEQGAKAKFLAIIISASVAIILFFLNQFFIQKKEKREEAITRKRDKRDLLIKKTEELYKESTLYFENILSYIQILSKIIAIKRKIDIHEVNGYTAIEEEEELKEEEIKYTELFRKQSLHKHNTQMLISLYFVEYYHEDYYPLNKEYKLDYILRDLIGKESSKEDIIKALDKLTTLKKRFKIFYIQLAEQLSNE